MSFVQQGFYTGYLCKIAEDTEDAELPWSVRHPILNAMGGGVAGAVGGTAAGAVGGAVSGGVLSAILNSPAYEWEHGSTVRDQMALAGGTLGAAVGLPFGTMAGIALAINRSRDRAREANTTAELKSFIAGR